MSSISSKKRTKTSRPQVVKSNSFVLFLEEFTAWQFAFEFYWPLVWIMEESLNMYIKLKAFTYLFGIYFFYLLYVFFVEIKNLGLCSVIDNFSVEQAGNHYWIIHSWHFENRHRIKCFHFGLFWAVEAAEKISILFTFEGIL